MTAQQRFVEMAGDMLEEHGLPHMAGRVLGALLICVPPSLSMAEMADRLQASKGSISTATQLLLRLGFIEKLSIPGQRAHAYQVKPDLFSGLFAQRTEHLHRHRRLVRLGLDLLHNESPEAKRRVLEMKLFFEFVDAQLPELMARWDRFRSEALADAQEASQRKDRS